MKIDVHAHLYPDAYAKEVESLCSDLVRDGSWRGPMSQAGTFSPQMLRSEEERIAEMNTAGIDVQVLSLSIPNVYFEDSAKSLYLAQIANDSFAEVCRKYPGRFMALASIPLEFPDLAVQEMHRAIDRLGMCGLVIGGNIRGKPLNSPEFLPVFQEADRMNLAIFIHPMLPAGIEALREYGMAASIGYLADSTTAITRLVFSGLFEKCPNLKMIIPHMGGIVPFNIERIDYSYRTRPECRQNISMPPSEYFKRFYYDSANYHVPSMRCGYETFGARHMVVGSDFPFRPVKSAEFITTIRALGLSEEEEELIFSGNALRILRH